MATLALSAAGSAAGGALLPGGLSFFGASIGGAAAGRALGALAGAYVDQALFGASGQTSAGAAPRLSDLQVTASTEGAPIPKLYGRARLGGQVIWATNFEEEISGESSAGKGTGSAAAPGGKSYRYYGNFAVALCEGVIARIGRCWADGAEIDLSQFTHRVYRGDEAQAPDSLIEAKQGAGNAPAYRGVAYVVFERMPLKNFGNRLPQLNFEIFRAVDDFEGAVKAVTLIPAAGEFAYAPGEVRRQAGAGVTLSENRHSRLGGSDFSVSMDQLQASLPNAGAVSLFVAWFGDDLRAGACRIKPKVELSVKPTSPLVWSVAGLSRSEAGVVSTHEGRPAYGGTPSDNSVIAAIADLKARGLEVVFTPFVLMDIPESNSLPDPYGGAAQPAHPWRGRITCHPAASQLGSPDKTSAAAAQVSAFVNAEWGYRRFILHCARLCEEAGGVDAFVIGSEMRGLTWVRGGVSSYPFVDALAALAADVKAILPDAKITYAADWSEYFGHQPADGSGDVHFHLDPLWASPAINAIGIDNYWPLADWRDGLGHADYAAGHRSIYDLSYLKSNIAGGEGFDWHYASAGNRDSQTRTPIADGAYGKPWVFRYKDVKSWWKNAHFNRPGGAESAAPTAWVPQSKPIWFMEIGCPAADKGANQPNVFYDPKSSESLLPYYSRGLRDDLMQRRHLKALLEWYDPARPDFQEAQNPQSAVYAGRMADVNRIFVYTWDARPYPAFPNNLRAWSDGANWSLGHWLTGRAGGAPLAETVAQILADYGFADFGASELAGHMQGYVIDRVMSARDAIQPLELAFFFDSFESGGKIRFAHRGRPGPAVALSADDLVEASAGAARYELTRGQETELPQAVKLSFADAGKDYEPGAAEARRLAMRSGRLSQASLPIVMDYDQAREIADIWLHETWAAREAAALTLPPSRMALEPGDVVTLAAAGRAFDLRLTGLSAGDALEAEARSIGLAVYDRIAGRARPQTAAPPAVYGPTVAAFMDLPLITGSETPHAGRIAAFQSPWPGSAAFYRSPSDAGFALNASADAPAIMGETLSPLFPGPTARWDYGNALSLRLYHGQINAWPALNVLGGLNIAAIENADGEWELVQFLNTALTGEKTYEISALLRGQHGTEGAMRAPVAAGARFVLIDDAVIEAAMTLDDAGLAFQWKYGPAAYDIGHPVFHTVTRAFHGLGLRPFSPAHLRGVRSAGGDLAMSWVRRTRFGGDGWEAGDAPLNEEREAYEVRIMSGGAVIRTLQASAPFAVYPAAQQTADFGAPQPAITVRVHQLSAVFGRGAPREAVL